MPIGSFQKNKERWQTRAGTTGALMKVKNTDSYISRVPATVLPLSKHPVTPPLHHSVILTTA